LAPSVPLFPWTRYDPLYILPIDEILDVAVLLSAEEVFKVEEMSLKG
jgi:hypothetical protein